MHHERAKQGQYSEAGLAILKMGILKRRNKPITFSFLVHWLWSQFSDSAILKITGTEVLAEFYCNSKIALGFLLHNRMQGNCQ